MNTDPKIKLLNGKMSSNAIIYQDQRYSYGELHEITNKLCQEFIGLGIRANDNVLISFLNPLSFLLCFIALWEMRANIILVDPKSTQEQFFNFTQFSEGNYFLCDNDLDDAFFTNLNQIKSLCGIVHYDGNDLKLIQQKDGSRQTWMRKRSIAIKYGALIVFTSGTSGMPKGVIHSKLTILDNVRKFISYAEFNENDSVLLTLPLNYCFGLSLAISHLLAGACIVLAKSTNQALFLLNQIKQYQVTSYAATPYFFEMLVAQMKKQSKNIELPHLKRLLNAGGFIKPHVIENIFKYLSDIKFINNYGQTEAGPRIAYRIFTRHSKSFEGVGKLLPGISIHIVDDSGNPLPKGEVGEIIYRSEDVMLCYYHEENLSCELDDYIHSADLGYIDSDDNLCIVGRKDSMVKINGRKVYLRAVEEKLYTINGVDHIKLSRKEHPLYGEYLSADVVCRIDMPDKEKIAYLKSEARKILGLYESPKEFNLKDKLILTARGKIKY